jgi:hypothetical protein
MKFVSIISLFAVICVIGCSDETFGSSTTGEIGCASRPGMISCVHPDGGAGRRKFFYCYQYG